MIKGKHHSLEAKRKMSISKKGSIPWNKKYDFCTIEGCGNKHDSHGLCHNHASIFRRKRDPIKYKIMKKRQYQNQIHTNRSRANKNRKINRLSALETYSKGKFVCACCGCNDYDCLTIDHIYNDGAKHRKEIGASNLYSWLKVNNYPEGFQVLCYNCNMVKGHYGYCRVHQESTDGGE